MLATSIIFDLKIGKTVTLCCNCPSWSYHNGILYSGPQIFIPENAKLRRSIIRDYHDSLPASHPGHFRTQALITPHDWWPQMGSLIRQYIMGCSLCQQMKLIRTPDKAAILPIKSHATHPFEQLSLDFITNLPGSLSFDSIMVVVDHGLTKGVIFSPCTKTISATDTATLFIENVYHCFGLPSVMISDQGPQFSAKVFQEITKILKIDHRMSTAYHPQTD